jgi:hypothetical protein
MAADPSISVDYNAVGTWMEQWERTLRNLDRIGACYGGKGGVNEVTEGVQLFLVSCYHVHDHIRKDRANLPSLDRSHIWPYFAANPYLPITQAFANTDKHGRPTRPSDSTARVTNARHDPFTNSATVSYIAPPQAQVNYDGLQLAENCVAAWRQFFTIEGITPPK